MQTDEVISKAESFASSFIAKLSDLSSQTASKQIYFLDNQEVLKKYMGAMQKIISSYKEEGTMTDDDKLLVDRATTITTKLKDCIAEFQKQLIVDEDVTEEEITPSLTNESISDAMKNNKTTQDIAANMEAISKQKETKALPYNYMLVCDEVNTMISAHDKQSLETNINAVVDSGNFKDIKLYRIHYTLVPLKKKTILSV